MTNYVVSSGQTTSGLTLYGNAARGRRSDTETVRSGGVSIGTTVSHYAVEYVESGGVSSDNQVRGNLIISSGGLSVNDTTYGGIETVLGAEVSATIVGGQQYVSSGGVIRSETVQRGSVYIDSGSALSLTLEGGELSGLAGAYISGGSISGGVESLLSGASGLQETITGGGVVSVFAGGSAQSVMVAGGGRLALEEGAVLSDVTVGSGGVVEFDNLTISSGQVFEVSPTGATVSGVTVSSGGRVAYADVDVRSGGLVVLSEAVALSNTTVEAGGIVSGGGVLTKSTVHHGGLAEGVVVEGYIFNIGVVSAAAVSSGGTLETFDGGSDVDIVIRRGVEYLDGGSATGTRAYGLGAVQEIVSGVAVSSLLGLGARQHVSAGGSALGVVVGAGAQQEVLAGGYASGVVLRGSASALDLGVVENVDVKSGGVLTVDSYGRPGSASDVVVENGGLVEVSGGRASSLVVQGGGTLRTVARGSALGAVIESAGFALDGGYQSGTVVSAGGREIVGAGGSDRGDTLVGVVDGWTATSSHLGVKAAVQIVDGGQVSGVTVSSGGYQRLEFDAGALSGGAALGDTVVSGGVVEVDIGGVLSGAVVSSGGELLIYNGYQAVTALSLRAGAVIALGDQGAASARFIGAKLVVISGGHAVESFSTEGSTSGLGLAVTKVDGQTWLTVVSASATSAGQPRSLVEAAARFGAESVPLSLASGTEAQARGATLLAPRPFGHAQVA